MKISCLWTSAKLVYCSFAMFLISSCSGVQSDVLIYEGDLVLSPQPITKECKKPLNATKRSNAILLVFSDDWSLEGKLLRRKDGKVAIVNVTLIDDHNNRHTTEHYGEVIGNGMHAMTADFSHLSRKINIVKVELTCSIEFLCRQVIWHSYDPM